VVWTFYALFGPCAAASSSRSESGGWSGGCAERRRGSGTATPTSTELGSLAAGSVEAGAPERAPPAGSGPSSRTAAQAPGRCAAGRRRGLAERPVSVRRARWVALNPPRRPVAAANDESCPPPATARPPERFRARAPSPAYRASTAGRRSTSRTCARLFYGPRCCWPQRGMLEGKSRHSARRARQFRRW
jgi:hypothetical protein